MMEYVLVDGKPVAEPNIIKFGQWMQDNHAERVVDRTKVAEGVEVSTVFLGLDHSFNGGTPVLWETMVFGGELDGEQDRYTSREDAERGHADMVERVQKAEAAATIPDGELCGGCKKVRGQGDHTCPFAEEIHDRHDLCNCCSDCTHECAMDI